MDLKEQYKKIKWNKKIKNKKIKKGFNLNKN